MSINKQAIYKAAKEVARLAFFGAIASVLSWATTQVASLPADSVYAIVGTVVLRFIDKYVHANENIEAKGLLPF